MKIVFCTNYRGQSAVTTNMLSAAILTDILYDKRSVLMQTQPDKNQLEIPLMDFKKRSRLLKKDRGMDQLAGGISGCTDPKELLGNMSVPVPDSSISFIPGGYAKEEKAYVEMLTGSFLDIIEAAEELYETVFIDAGVIPDKLMKVMYQEADLIAVCLNQNKRVLDDFFYFGHKNKKMLYIISIYDKDSAYAKEQLIEGFHELNSGNTFLMPYNIGIRDALSGSKLFSFFYTNIGCDKSEGNYEFIQSALKLTRYINQYG